MKVLMKKRRIRRIAWMLALMMAFLPVGEVLAKTWLKIRIVPKLLTLRFEGIMKAFAGMKTSKIIHARNSFLHTPVIPSLLPEQM